jgi:hypothetical protein
MMAKKSLVVLFLVMISLVVVACSADEAETPQAQMPNPVQESSAEEIMEELGFSLMTPYGAEDIVYSIIDMGDEGKIAQVDFTLDDIGYNYRASAAAEWTDISGMYYDWTEEVDTDVSYCSGKTLIADDGDTIVGVILWYDAVPGIQYSLSMDSDADYTVLWFMAEQLFQPSE